MLQADIVYAVQTQEMEWFCVNGILRETKQGAKVPYKNQDPS